MRGTEKANIFFSPSSIHGALAMVYAGAQGRTAQEMKPYYGDNLPATHRNFRRFIASLRSYKANKLEVANALWGQKNFSFSPEFLALIKECYDGALFQVDFSQPAEAIAPINQWANEKTHGKIPTILYAHNVNKDTHLVLTMRHISKVFGSGLLIPRKLRTRHGKSTGI